MTERLNNSELIRQPFLFILSNMTLKDIVQIQELSPRISVSGVTRENVFPFDYLEIEGATYAVRQIQTNEDGTKSFVASVRGYKNTWDFNFKKCN